MDSTMLWYSGFLCKLFAKKDSCQDDVLSSLKDLGDTGIY